MRTAYKKGLNVFTLTDCMAATTEEEQRVAIEKDYPMFSHPVEHNEFLGCCLVKRLRPRAVEESLNKLDD